MYTPVYTPPLYTPPVHPYYTAIEPHDVVEGVRQRCHSRVRAYTAG